MHMHVTRYSLGPGFFCSASIYKVHLDKLWGVMCTWVMSDAMAPVQTRREHTCRQFLQLHAFSSSLLARALPIISSANCTQWDKVRQLASRRGSAIVSGRYLWEGNGNPLQYSCLGNPMDRGAWKGYSPWWSERVRHNWVTKHTHTNTRTHTLLLHTHMVKLNLNYSCFRFLTSPHSNHWLIILHDASSQQLEEQNIHMPLNSKVVTILNGRY